MNKSDILDYSSEWEVSVRREFFELFKNSPIPEDQVMSNLGLFINSKLLSRILFLNEMYKKIIEVQGIIIDFGCHWGQNASIFSALRGIYEPFNRHRKLLALDTFSGFPSISSEDGNSNLMKVGQLETSKNYELYLKNLLHLQDCDNPLSHIKKFEIIKGEAVEKFKEYLEKHPETIVALAYFDFDLYKPTKECLKLIEPYLTKGSVLVFDELNDLDSPGETIALREVFGLSKFYIKRFKYASRVSYLEIE